jgi:hypothetical protein
MIRCSNYLELTEGGQYYGLVGIRPIEDRNTGIHHNIMHWLRSIALQSLTNGAPVSPIYSLV